MGKNERDENFLAMVNVGSLELACKDKEDVGEIKMTRDSVKPICVCTW